MPYEMKSEVEGLRNQIKSYREIIILLKETWGSIKSGN